MRHTHLRIEVRALDRIVQLMPEGVAEQGRGLPNEFAVKRLPARAVLNQQGRALLRMLR